MTIRELHNNAASCLRDQGIKEARREAGVLLSALLKLPLAHLYSHPEHVISLKTADKIMQAAWQLAHHVPLAYLTGETEFFGLQFSVFPGVLIPRPDSEVLVEAALNWIGRSLPHGIAAANERADLYSKEAGIRPHLRILDLCTGTGCIGISLARTLLGRGYSVFLQLTDIDPHAISCARLNLQNHQLTGCSLLTADDLFPAHFDQPFDLLVSNPPYIATDVVSTLMPEVLEHEPHLALDGGPDGLDFYRRIISRAPDFLAEKGLMLLEHGWDQADALTDLIEGNGSFHRLPLIFDYGMNPRVSSGTRKINA